MKKTMLALVAISLVALLAACEFNVYTPPSFDEEVNADTWTDATLAGAPPTDTVRLEPGETFRYKVVLPSVGLEAVYYMLDTELDLTLLDRFADPVASSASSDYFTRGTLALSAAADAELEPADVTAQLSCLGSCVIERRSGSGSPRYVRIHNPTGSAVTTAFYALQRDFEDTNESTAPAPLGTGTTDGALETLGDVDRYEIVQAGDVELVFGTLAAGLDYRLRVYSAGGALIDTLFPGDPPVEVFAGEEVRVDATNGGDRAGASGKSRYQIGFQAGGFAATAEASVHTGPELIGADPAYDYDLAPGESVLVRVDLPASGQPAVYYELEDEIDLTVLEDDGSTAVASSSSTDFFTSGTLALSAASGSAVGTSDVTAQLSCRGSCVIEAAGPSRRYVEIANDGGGAVAGSLYVIQRQFEDTVEGNEPGSLGLGSTDGALETLDDVDVYEVDQAGDVELVFGALASGLNYRLRIYSAGGTLIDTLFPGDPAVEVFVGEEIRVDATNGGDRAGASGKSRYQIALN
jgi:hypothetical protein